MGPYVFASLGVKVDNLIIYPLAIIVLATALLKKEVKINKSVLGIFVIWMLATIFMIVRTFIFGGQLSTYAFLAEIKNLTQPLAIVLLFLVVIISKDREKATEVMRKTSFILIYLLCLNTTWIFLGFFINLDSINQLFWGGEISVAANAVENGRFSGIFNQPIEAGIVYTIGLLVWLYLAEKKFMKINLKSVIYLLLLFVGGALTVSKVFVIAGVVMFFIGVLSVKIVRRRIIPISIIFVLIGYPVYIYLTKTWTGLGYLFRFFDVNNYQSQGFLMLITAGRYGSDTSQQSDYFQKIWETAPLLGEGLGSQRTYDSALFHFFSSGGLISLSMYIILLLIIARMVYETYRYTGFNAETKLFLGLFVLIIVGGLGAPILTLNRSSIVIWVFVGLLLQYLCVIKTQRINDKNALSTQP